MRTLMGTLLEAIEAEKSFEIAPASLGYAFAVNGAAVEASSSTHGHPPELAINGIMVSPRWHRGDGWESVLSLRSGYV